MLNLVAVGRKIQSLRKEEGLSQDELAELLRVTRQAVSQWETGQSAPSIDSLVELHRQFRIPMDVLLCLDEPLDVDPEDIFAGHSREYILREIEEERFPLPLSDVLYQLSPRERMRVLCSYRNRHRSIPHDLFVKLTIAEQSMMRKGGLLP